MMAPIVEGRDLFPEQWIRVQELGVRVGRIQHCNNWSPAMSPGPANTCLGMESFCFAGDELREDARGRPDRTVAPRGGCAGLAPTNRMVDGAVVRVGKAHSVYAESYAGTLQAGRDFWAGVPNLKVFGHNRRHGYNDQDHSVLTVVPATRNVLGGRYDSWSVNP